MLLLREYSGRSLSENLARTTFWAVCGWTSSVARRPLLDRLV